MLSTNCFKVTTPVYVSDKPGEHNFDLLRKLVMPNGSVLNAWRAGRPTRDCLFHAPTREDVLLKIFSLDYFAQDGMVGVFNARYDAEREIVVTGDARPSDVEGIEGERFAVYTHFAGTVEVMNREERRAVSLKPLECELFTFVAIRDGVAPIGLADMFQSARSVSRPRLLKDGTYALFLHAGGRFLAWCEKFPVEVTVADTPHDFTYQADTHSLEVVISLELKHVDVEIQFTET